MKKVQRVWVKNGKSIRIVHYSTGTVNGPCNDKRLLIWPFGKSVMKILLLGRFFDNLVRLEKIHYQICIDNNINWKNLATTNISAIQAIKRNKMSPHEYNVCTVLQNESLDTNIVNMHNRKNWLRKRKYYINQQNLLRSFAEEISEEWNKLNAYPKRQADVSKNNYVSSEVGL